GIWQSGEFMATPDPSHELTPEDILLVSGTEDQLSALKRLTLSEARRHPRGRVVVAGLGRVGSTVAGEIAASQMTLTTVDLMDAPDVDVVGDATEEEVLQEAGVDSADALVVARADDTAAMYAVLVARELNPTVQILVRADENESVPKLYRAGADYVLALATVSGRILASEVLENEEVMAPQSQVEIVRTTAPVLSGQSLAGADIRSRTGVTVIGIERNGSVLTDLKPSFVIEEGDRLFLAGTDEGIGRFNELAQ
ncbi:MAG: TrkA family potassium uptake protein, partial [Halobacteriales archaeon]|nr:TrkA family potassium uptake protein [Halobacteriales archaeon]